MFLKENVCFEFRFYWSLLVGIHLTISHHWWQALPEPMINKFSDIYVSPGPWWRHQKETFSTLLAICAGNSLVTGEFPTQRPVTQSLDVFFDLCLNKCLSKQSWGWWFEMPSHLSWRHCNAQLNILREIGRENLGMYDLYIWTNPIHSSLYFLQNAKTQWLKLGNSRNLIFLRWNKTIDYKKKHMKTPNAI